MCSQEAVFISSLEERIGKGQFSKLPHSLHTHERDHVMSKLAPEPPHLGDGQVLVQASHPVLRQHCLLIGFVQPTAELRKSLTVRNASRTTKLSPTKYFCSNLFHDLGTYGKS